MVWRREAMNIVWLSPGLLQLAQREEEYEFQRLQQYYCRRLSAWRTGSDTVLPSGQMLWHR